MLSLVGKAFESMGRQTKRARTLDMRPWLNAKYPQFRNLTRNNIASRVRTLTRTRTKTQTRGSPFIPLGESGFIKKRRYRPLSFRRRRRFRRRVRSSYDRAILRDIPGVVIQANAATGNNVFYQRAPVADPDVFVKANLTIPANNTSRLFYDKVGTNLEVYNPGSYNLNFRLIWGTVDEVASAALMLSYATANPPQFNPSMGNHVYNTIWDSIRGSYSGKIPCGGRQKFNTWSNLGSRRLEDVETSRKAKFHVTHIMLWPDFVVTSATTPAVAYPNIDAPVIMTQHYYHIGYPPSLTQSFIQTPVLTMPGLAAPTATWITKQEDLTEDQT